MRYEIGNWVAGLTLPMVFTFAKATEDESDLGNRYFKLGHWELGHWAWGNWVNGHSELGNLMSHEIGWWVMMISYQTGKGINI